MYISRLRSNVLYILNTQAYPFFKRPNSNLFFIRHIRIRNISQFIRYICNAFFLFQCVLILLKTIVDKNFYLFKEQNGVILLINKYN